MQHIRPIRAAGAQLWLVLLCAALLMTGCGNVAAPATNDAAAISTSPATPEISRDFTLPTLNGGTLSLSDLRGEWVVLNFWATWCAPCVKEMPYLSTVAETRDVHVVGVNFNEDAATVRKFVADHAIDFPILLDPDDITLLVYGVRGLPRTFVIAPDGTIAHSVIGQLDPDRFDRWLDEHGVPLRQ
ncbi:MAG: TlpA family protein disulfide reductase [Caldilinea sp.]|nr:TlpA family protein disulfide reductase [Caldilinea sp.]MCB0058736.1 TlpA family protein disulfide reductase [Caldilineaceae bacterium]MCB0040203.1 TlpA family protein disulfide reductase [Caldilinea sp.]MCB0067628.1 TlpA family protein disulfide reductase [Caldilineaceae bacterium]MCB0146932.1 TlpA family protein disulfide reductase [Caldilineaceae bacterium]